MTGRGEMRSSDERRFTGFLQGCPSVGYLAARYQAQAPQARAQARLTSRHQVRKLLLRHAETLEELARQAEQAGEADASGRRLR